jgi:hypothetical protein
VRFNDDAEGEIDLTNDLEGEVFSPLKNINKFKSFKVDPILGTIVWENVADIARVLIRKYENSCLV